jgi:hypothetical protein
MAISHVLNNAVADFTGTVTVFNSQASTTTIAATNLVRPSDWNSAHNQFYTLSGNTSNASTASGTNVVFAASGGVTLIGSTNTIVVSAVPPGTATFWWPYNEGVNVAGQQGNGTWHIAPTPTPPTAALGQVQIDRMGIPVIFSNSTNSTGTATVSMSVGLYTLNAASLSLQHSTTGTLAVTFSGTVNNSTYAGIRLMTIPWSTTIDDNRYYVAIASRTTTGGANCSVSQMLNSQINSNFSGLFGANSNRSHQWPLGLGVYSASSSGFPNPIPLSQIDGTATLACRPPSWFMVSGTV